MSAATFPPKGCSSATSFSPPNGWSLSSSTANYPAASVHSCVDSLSLFCFHMNTFSRSRLQFRADERLGGYPQHHCRAQDACRKCWCVHTGLLCSQEPCSQRCATMTTTTITTGSHFFPLTLTLFTLQEPTGHQSAARAASLRSSPRSRHMPQMLVCVKRLALLSKALQPTTVRSDPLPPRDHGVFSLTHTVLCR